MRLGSLFIGVLFLTTSVCAASANGTKVAFHHAFWSVISPDAEVIELAPGFTWSEGPAWDKERQRLYFSDVPENKAYMWSPREGLAIFMSPSGLQSDQVAGFREAGSNGLVMASDNHLLIANHGNRAVELMEIDTGLRKTIANRYDGLRFNSPNDIAQAANGTVYFTDPPYGLEGLDKSPLMEQPHSGVYRVSTDGTVRLVDGTLTFPNGVALSPNEQRLYVTVSDPLTAKVYVYKQTNVGFAEKSLFFDAQPFVDQGWQGLPDGMAVAETGHLFVAGPGGIFVLSEEGQALGLLKLQGATANCAFGLDGNTLFITSGSRLLSVQTIVTGAQRQND